MKETVIIIWAVMALISGFLFWRGAKYHKRKLSKWVLIHQMTALVICYGIGALVYSFLADSKQIIWVVRLVFVGLGIAHLWGMYAQKWPKKDIEEYAKDGLFPELLFTALIALLGVIAFVAAPKTLRFVASDEQLSQWMWELPLLFLLPFLFVKLLDFSSQVPFREVENPYVFPIEPVQAQHWPWRELMQVNFQLKKSLQQEYRIFKSSAKPWIEAPKEVALGKIFQLTMQERRRKEGLETVQDLGNEYAGSPKFCWIFWIKVVWWNPKTWRRNPRFLDPDDSILKNKIIPGDVIVARRIPGDGTKRRSEYGQTTDEDKTVLL